MHTDPHRCLPGHGGPVPRPAGDLPRWRGRGGLRDRAHPLFSLMFQYHYVYLIVSSAVAGLSIGAAVAPALRKGDVAWGDLAAAAVLLIRLVGAAVVLATALGPPDGRGAGGGVAAVRRDRLPQLGDLALRGGRRRAVRGGFWAGTGWSPRARLLAGRAGWVIALGIVAGLVAMILAWTAAGRSARGGPPARPRPWLCCWSPTRPPTIARAGRLKDAPPDKTLSKCSRTTIARRSSRRAGAVRAAGCGADRRRSVRYVFTDAGAGSVMIATAAMIAASPGCSRTRPICRSRWRQKRRKRWSWGAGRARMC